MAPPEPTETFPELSHTLRLQHGDELASASCLMVAFSGGLDSTVLLALLHELQQGDFLSGRLEAVHVNHGMQASAGAWEAHCRQICEARHIPLHVRQVQVNSAAGSGPEAAARHARYAVFRELLPPGGLLLQGHHLDDQSETLLLHLLRGSGPRGLGGIPYSRPLGAGRVLRPLLSIARSRLQQHARLHQLDWIEDPSNADTALDRNYLRQALLPLLKQRWPTALDNIGRSAALLNEAEQMLEALAAVDLQTVIGAAPTRLALGPLQELSNPRQRNVIRYWIRSLCGEGEDTGIPFAVLQDGLRTLLAARSDAVPTVAWGRGSMRLELRRFRGELYLVRAWPDPPQLDVEWRGGGELQLPSGLGTLRLVTEAGVPEDLHLQVCLRRGGESICVPGRGTRTLKNLLQECAIAPWLRARIPLVFGKGELLVVPGVACSEHWESFVGCSNARIVWQQTD